MDAIVDFGGVGGVLQNISGLSPNTRSNPFTFDFSNISVELIRPTEGAYSLEELQALYPIGGTSSAHLKFAVMWGQYIVVKAPLKINEDGILIIDGMMQVTAPPGALIHAALIHNEVVGPGGQILSGSHFPNDFSQWKTPRTELEITGILCPGNDYQGNGNMREIYGTPEGQAVPIVDTWRFYENSRVVPYLPILEYDKACTISAGEEIEIPFLFGQRSSKIGWAYNAYCPASQLSVNATHGDCSIVTDSVTGQNKVRFKPYDHVGLGTMCELEVTAKGPSIGAQSLSMTWRHIIEVTGTATVDPPQTTMPQHLIECNRTSVKENESLQITIVRADGKPLETDLEFDLRVEGEYPSGTTAPYPTTCTPVSANHASTVKIADCGKNPDHTGNINIKLAVWSPSIGKFSQDDHLLTITREQLKTPEINPTSPMQAGGIQTFAVTNPETGVEYSVGASDKLTVDINGSDIELQADLVTKTTQGFFKITASKAGLPSVSSQSHYIMIEKNKVDDPRFAQFAMTKLEDETFNIDIEPSDPQPIYSVEIASSLHGASCKMLDTNTVQWTMPSLDEGEEDRQCTATLTCEVDDYDPAVFPIMVLCKQKDDPYVDKPLVEFVEASLSGKGRSKVSVTNPETGASYAWRSTGGKVSPDVGDTTVATFEASDVTESAVGTVYVTGSKSGCKDSVGEASIDITATELLPPKITCVDKIPEGDELVVTLVNYTDYAGAADISFYFKVEAPDGEEIGVWAAEADIETDAGGKVYSKKWTAPWVDVDKTGCKVSCRVVRGETDLASNECTFTVQALEAEMADLQFNEKAVPFGTKIRINVDKVANQAYEVLDIPATDEGKGIITEYLVDSDYIEVQLPTEEESNLYGDCFTIYVKATRHQYTDAISSLSIMLVSAGDGSDDEPTYPLPGEDDPPSPGGT